MSSTASATGDVLPALPPIRTAVKAPSPPRVEDERRSSPPSSSSTASDAESRPSTEKEEEEAEPTTPTWEESRLRPLTECPPAPRKPAWAPPPPAAHPGKRKFAPSPTSSAAAPSAARRPPVAFFPVARDLTTVFRALPPKKRIRAV